MSRTSTAAAHAMAREADDAFRRDAVTARNRLAQTLNDPAGHRERLLGELVRETAGTEFGAEHAMARIRTIDDYRAAVPLRTYQEYAPWIARSADGRSRVLTQEDPRLFFTTSGSTGARKRIPVTRTFLDQVYLPFFRAAMGVPAQYFPDAVSLGAATLNLRHDRLSRPATTQSGRPSLGPSQADLRGGFGITLKEPGSEAPWAQLPVDIHEQNYLDKLYVRIRMAAQHDVRCVIGHNPAMLAILPELLTEWWPTLLRDLRDGTYLGRAGGVPDPGRAAELERRAAAESGVRPSVLWPRIQLLYCWTSGIASLYLPRLKELYGTDVTVLPTPPAASEGPVGVPMDLHPTAGPLAVSTVLYEFVDAGEDVRPDSRTLLCEDLEPGRYYHVVLSHVGGLFRYVLGDVAYVVDRIGSVPRVEYAGRAAPSDVAGERLREFHVVNAVREAAQRTGAAVTNMTCRPDADGEDGDGTPRYHTAVALRNGPRPGEADGLGRELERALRATAPDYSRAREDGRLGPASVKVVPEEAFTAHWHRRVTGGMRPPEVKDQVFQPDPAAWARLTES